MTTKYFRHAVVFALVALCAVGAFAQTSTSGSITGKVLDQSKTALPGVTLELRSPQLQGARTEVTDSSGSFRFSLLPPGNYNLTATLAGFNPVKQENVHVELNRTVSLEVTMSPQVSEQITVTGAAPVVDVTSASSGANVSSETIRSLPIGRTFTAIAQVAPGTNRDGTGTQVYGSSGAENQIVIEGLNVTNVSHGTEGGKTLNFDFVQEVEVITGGLPAEYGRMTGGVINAITKSGSNEFHGDIFGYNAGGSLRSNPKYQDKLSATATTIPDVDSQYDYGANLGGYIMKDRLWFFGAYDRTSETDISTRINTPLVAPGFTLPVGGTQSSDLTRDLYAGKLSFAATANHLINLSVFGDPSTFDGVVAGIAGPPSTFLGTQKTGGADIVARYSGIFGTNFTVSALGGKHREKTELGGEGTTISRITDQTVVPNTVAGGLGFYTNQKLYRDVAKIDLAAFFGNHQVKVGADRENLKADVLRFTSGGDRIRKRCRVSVPVGGSCAPENVFYTHESFIKDLSSTLDKTNPATFASNIISPLTSSPKTDNTSFYVQDSWKVFSNLTVNAGVRWEKQQVKSRTGEVAIDLDNNISPRLGVIFDLQNNGRSKLYANYGRFFESIPMDINIRAFGGELSVQVNNLSPTPGNLTPDPAAPAISGGKQFRFLGGGTEPVDPDLKGQHIEEYLAGYDQEIAPNFSVGIKGTYRNLKDVIEDMLVIETGEYFIANPSTGIGAVGGFLSGDAAPMPEPKRTYKGLELHATKRFSNNYQFFASYLWSRLEGNYDGTFQISTGQLDPNINSAYDYADFSVNNNGLLSADRTHQIKFYGSYTFSQGYTKGLDLGASLHWASGAALTGLGYEFAGYRNYEYYLTERGQLGHGPSEYEADLHLGYPIAFSNSRLNLLVDVFNLFNRQAISALDMRMDLPNDAACAVFKQQFGSNSSNVCNGFGGWANVPGTTNPVGRFTDPRASATNPDFLKKGTGSGSFTGQRSIRIGARWSF
jgi:outer membrane receptor protein involved in Fe transport